MALGFSQPLFPSIAPPPPSTNLKVSKLWSLSRYARHISNKRPQVLYGDTGTTSVAKATTQWDDYDHTDHPDLKLSLIEGNHLMVTTGDKILESILLWECQKWIKAYAKGDSILFIYNQNKQNRRFRVKLLSLLKDKTPTDVCREVIEALKPLILIEDIGMSTNNQHGDQHRAALAMETCSQTGLTCSQIGLTSYSQQRDPNPIANETTPTSSSSSKVKDTSNQIVSTNQATPTNHHDSTATSVVSISTIGQNILETRPLGGAYASTHLPTEQLSQFIKLCLSDSEFPSFVEAVATELNNL